MAIKIKSSKGTSKQKVDPYYRLVFNYMIGDANGYTTEEQEVSLNNPYLERFVKLLNKLKPTKSTWGIVFEEYDFENFYKEKQITKNDYDFLKKIMFYGDDDDDLEDENYEFIEELRDGVRGQAEYSFLVFQGCDLTYIDENDNEHDVEFK